MHEHFADWHKEASIEPRQLPLEERWTVIESDVSEPNKEEVLDLIEWAFSGDPTPGDSGWFRALFKAVEPAFSMRDNAAEMGVLAASTLIHLMDKRSEVATLAALAILNGRAGLGDPVVADLYTAANNYITTHSSSQRRLTRPLVTLDRKVEQEILESLPSGQWPAIGIGIAQLFQSATDSLGNVAQYAAKVERVRGEEVNVLWWVLSERSRDSESRWSEESLASRPAAVAKELADLTSGSLPHPRARHLLARVLLIASDGDAEVSPAQVRAEGAAACADLAQVVAEDRSGAFTPILTFLGPDEEGARSRFKSCLYDRPWNQVDLAEQVLSEALLYRAAMNES